MDAGTTLKHVAPFLVPIFALLIPLLAIAIGGWSKVRRNRELHETIRQITSRGQTVPAELLAQLNASASSERREWSPQSSMRAGFINVGVGLGLMVFFYALRPDGWLWAIGAIPLGLGVAMLLSWRFERRETDRGAR